MSADPVVVLVLVMILVSSASFVALKVRGSERPTPLDALLKLLAVPLVAAGMLALVLVRSRAEGPVRRDGDDDLDPLDGSVDEPPETSSDKINRILEDQADEVEAHVLEEATDDEVAARGASAFDPGSD